MEDQFIQDLARSGITEEQAEMAGIYFEANGKDVFSEFKSSPVTVFPYLDPRTQRVMEFRRDGKLEEFARVRYHTKAMPGRKIRRYDQPRSSGVMPYFPLADGLDWQTVFADPTYPIVFTEGEKKALALAVNGVAAIGLGGVYNFMDDGRFLELLEDIRWSTRSAIILFDSDRAKNPNIRVAEDRLASEISLKRGGEVFLVSLPDDLDGSKQGVDDFIVAHGIQALHALVEGAAVPMRKIDAAVRRMNTEAAWIDGEGLVYDLKNRAFLPKADFVRGSRFGNEKVTQAAGNGNSVKTYNVAEEWLTHPEHRIYSSVVFDPSTEEQNVTLPGGAMALNMWTGWNPSHGDTKPFHRLNDYLFKKLPDDWRDLPLKLMAYKAQNPHEKIPLSLVLIGPEGCGKSLWAKIMRLTYAPYGKPVSSAGLVSDFNGWIERNLLAIIDEAKGVHVSKAAPELKKLISEDSIMLNEKFRVPKEVPNLSMVIMTSNERSVGAFGHNDRRMIVVDCPDPAEPELYQDVLRWIKNDGPSNLLGELLDWDLKGWKPPARAPLSAEKYMARIENMTPVQRLAEDMRTADYNTILMWIDSALSWAANAQLGNNVEMSARANEIVSTLSRMPIRPYYTPEELAMLFPMIAHQMYGYRKGAGTPSGIISKELREGGIPYLECKNSPMGFKVAGHYRQYLVIADPEEWAAPMDQETFDRLAKEWPTYGQVRNLQNKSQSK